MVLLQSMFLEGYTGDRKMPPEVTTLQVTASGQLCLPLFFASLAMSLGSSPSSSGLL